MATIVRHSNASTQREIKCISRENGWSEPKVSCLHLGASTTFPAVYQLGNLNALVRMRLQSNWEVFVRGALSLFALAIISMCILVPRCAAGPQVGASSSALTVNGGPVLGGTTARRKQETGLYGSGSSETLELAGGLTLQGVLFLALGFLWTNRSRRRWSALAKVVRDQESAKQSISGTDVENSPASAASISV